MKSKLLMVMATLLMALTCSVAAYAQQNPIIHFGTVQGTVNVPLRIPDGSNIQITCSNLRVWYESQPGASLKYYAPQPTGIGTCSYQIPNVLVGQPHKIGLAWVGPGDYEVLFYKNFTSMGVILDEPNEVLVYNFLNLRLREIIQ